MSGPWRSSPDFNNLIGDENQIQNPAMTLTSSPYGILNYFRCVPLRAIAAVKSIFSGCFKKHGWSSAMNSLVLERQVLHFLTGPSRHAARGKCSRSNWSQYNWCTAVFRICNTLLSIQTMPSPPYFRVLLRLNNWHWRQNVFGVLKSRKIDVDNVDFFRDLRVKTRVNAVLYRDH